MQTVSPLIDLSQARRPKNFAPSNIASMLAMVHEGVSRRELWHSFLVEVCFLLEADGAYILIRHLPEAAWQTLASSSTDRADEPSVRCLSGSLSEVTSPKEEPPIANAHNIRITRAHEADGLVINVLIELNTSKTALLQIRRFSRKPSPQSYDSKILPWLARHLQIALTTCSQFSAMSTTFAIWSQSFDRQHIGVAIVDAYGNVIATNRIAAHLISQAGAVLDFRQNDLARNGSLVANSLRSFLARGSSDLFAPVESLSINIRSAGRLDILMRSLDDYIIGGSKPLRKDVLIFIKQREKDGKIHFTQESERVLASLYRLTHRESAVAAHLIRGQRFQEAAASLRITTTTLRTHVRSIYRKLDVRTQTELVRRLLSSLAVVGGG